MTVLNELPDIHSAAAILGGKAKGNRILCPGPGHSRHDCSLKVTFRSDGGFSVTSFAGDDWQVCKDYVKARLGLSDEQPVPFAVPARPVSTGRTKARAEALARLWGSCVPIQRTPAELYLNRRGLSYEGDAWRYRPTSGSIVAIVTDAVTADQIGWHETLLDHDGNKLGRRMHGNVAGGAVRLYDSDILTGLAVAEGIETAIASAVRPVWACLSASVLMNFPVIPGVESLTVLADHDEAGVAAANAVGERWHEAGREVILTMPEKYGTDFADREAA